MNGWFVVYTIVCFINGLMYQAHGFKVNTWQFWAWAALILLAWLSGMFSRR